MQLTINTPKREESMCMFFFLHKKHTSMCINGKCNNNKSSLILEVIYQKYNTKSNTKINTKVRSNTKTIPYG